MDLETFLSNWWSLNLLDQDKKMERLFEAIFSLFEKEGETVRLAMLPPAAAFSLLRIGMEKNEMLGEEMVNNLLSLTISFHADWLRAKHGKKEEDGKY